MMKILKLLGIFVVLVGLIFLAIELPGWISPSEQKTEFADEDLIDISEQCDQIRKAWANQKGWSKELYEAQRSDIDQSKAMGLFSREGYNAVNNCLRESAVNKACEGYLAQLHESSFKESLLRQQYDGVVLLKDREQLGGDQRIKRIEDVDALYKKVKAFTSSSHAITPKFDTDKADWTSFATLQSGILNTAKNYRQNPLFKEMETVPGFKEGLDEAKLKEQTGSQRAAFYNRLSSQIIAYFRSEEPTTDKVNLLTQIWKNFTYQENSYGVDSLASFRVTYRVQQ